MKEQIRGILKETARRMSFITYKEIARLAGLDPRNPRVLRRIVPDILGEISEDETKGRRPMLSVVVVNKDTAFPGGGFFKLARRLGRQKNRDNHEFFVRELAKVYRHCTA